MWKADLEKTFKKDADLIIHKFLKKTQFDQAVKKWTPDLWIELKGISQGAGIENLWTGKEYPRITLSDDKPISSQWSDVRKAEVNLSGITF